MGQACAAEYVKFQIGFDGTYLVDYLCRYRKYPGVRKAGCKAVVFAECEFVAFKGQRCGHWDSGIFENVWNLFRFADIENTLAINVIRALYKHKVCITAQVDVATNNAAAHVEQAHVAG